MIYSFQANHASAPFRDVFPFFKNPGRWEASLHYNNKFLFNVWWINRNCPNRDLCGFDRMIPAGNLNCLVFVSSCNTFNKSTKTFSLTFSIWKCQDAGIDIWFCKCYRNVVFSCSPGDPDSSVPSLSSAIGGTWMHLAQSSIMVNVAIKIVWK